MGLIERAEVKGVGLEAANAIRGYLERAKGDARLALALSVADRLAAANTRYGCRASSTALRERY